MPSLRNKYRVNQVITRVANAALQVGSAKIPVEQKRVSTLNIDTDDEDDQGDVIDAEHSHGTAGDEETGDSDVDKEFDEITEQIPNVQTHLGRPNSL